jgi:hypothetical protein
LRQLAVHPRSVRRKGEVRDKIIHREVRDHKRSAHQFLNHEEPPLKFVLCALLTATGIFTRPAIVPVTFSQEAAEETKI